MKSKIYFIDNRLNETCKVIDAMKKYYRDQENGELDSTMFLVNINGESDKDTISYFTGVLRDSNTVLRECKNVEEIKERIAEISKENTIVMVDLHMANDELRKLEEDTDYKCISMQCMEELEKAGISYVWYSKHIGEDKFRVLWESRFRQLYNRQIPMIYERNDLIQAHFNVAVAKEILGE